MQIPNTLITLDRPLSRAYRNEIHDGITRELIELTGHSAKDPG